MLHGYILVPVTLAGGVALQSIRDALEVYAVHSAGTSAPTDNLAETVKGPVLCLPVLCGRQDGGGHAAPAEGRRIPIDAARVDAAGLCELTVRLLLKSMFVVAGHFRNLLWGR